jgi:hypothetical protein
VGKITLKKLTFKIDSPKNESNNDNEISKQSTFAKRIYLMKKGGVLNFRKSNETAAFKYFEKRASVCDNEDYSATDKISNYSSNKDGILILEDIGPDFAKRIKKIINKRVKFAKIRNLFEFQKQRYINSLNELYSLINKQNSNNNHDILIYIQEKLNETISNNAMFSKALESEEEETNIFTPKNNQFDTKTLKKISSESFEIKSSYENINKLSKGEIIKNIKYKLYLEAIIKKYLNNNKIFNEENLKEIITKKFECYKMKKMSEKGKGNNYYNYFNEKDNQKDKKNKIFDKNKTLILKSKILDLDLKKKLSQKSLDKHILIYNDNLNDYRSEEKKQKRKSKFCAQSSKQNRQYLQYINELKREADSTTKKNSRKNLYYKKIKTEAKKIYNNIRKSETEKKEKEKENNIVLTSSANAIIDFEKEIK